MAEWLRRYVQVVVNFVGVGSSPTGCTLFFDSTNDVVKWKNYAGTGIRARVKRITTVYANHNTIPPPTIVKRREVLRRREGLVVLKAGGDSCLCAKSSDD